MTYPGFRADFGRTCSVFAVEISLDRVIQEERILVEVVLRFLLCHSHGLAESLSWGLKTTKIRRLSSDNQERKTMDARMKFMWDYLPRCTWSYRCTYTGVQGRSCQYSHSWWARWRIFCCRPSDWPWGNCIALGFFRQKVAIFRKRCALAHCQVPEPTPSNLSKTVNMKVNNFCFLEKQFWAGCQFLNFNCIKETVSFFGSYFRERKIWCKMRSGWSPTCKSQRLVGFLLLLLIFFSHLVF